ncbi:hypothetical protein [Paenibacillus soyae]|uniref:Uncharacterized protein n=1 Tax=Paenibacillus soyae TaxID=2969249 RepID=A0A9X2MUS7_9BACL|nr:hypothetical protein [Paenibacillus soyae]MCR2803997.1 hypothetical protein [Paenibacillus soyae]
MRAIELKFHRAMLNTYERAKEDHGYQATYFKRMVVEKGGLQAAKELVASESASGFKELYMRGCLHLSVEVLVAYHEEFHELFTDEEIGMAKAKLDALSYVHEG